MTTISTAGDPACTARKRCFDPVVDANTRLLVLGSLPGERSLAAQQYYGNRHNRFWSLMSAVLDTELVALDYDSRLASLRAHGVGLWDVVAEAQRPGSLDSNIRAHRANDLWGLLESLPALQAIAFNGGTAAKIGLKILGQHAGRYRIFSLPSSSPAYTLPYGDKLQRWLALRAAVGSASGPASTPAPSIRYSP